jgi:hypothetical protein
LAALYKGEEGEEDGGGEEVGGIGIVWLVAHKGDKFIEHEEDGVVTEGLEGGERARGRRGGGGEAGGRRGEGGGGGEGGDGGGWEKYPRIPDSGTQGQRSSAHPILKYVFHFMKKPWCSRRQKKEEQASQREGKRSRPFLFRVFSGRFLSRLFPIPLQTLHIIFFIAHSCRNRIAITSCGPL